MNGQGKSVIRFKLDEDGDEDMDKPSGNGADGGDTDDEKVEKRVKSFPLRNEEVSRRGMILIGGKEGLEGESF